MIDCYKLIGRGALNDLVRIGHREDSDGRSGAFEPILARESRKGPFDANRRS